MPALALTDYLSMSGSIEFYLACQKVGIQPILGLQVPVSSPLKVAPIEGDLIVLAYDLSGWRSLCRLSSALHAKPSVDIKTNLPFSDFVDETIGLICLTGGSQGNIDRLIREGLDQAARRYLEHLAELFPDRLYVELQRRTPEEGIISERLERLGKDLKLPLVATNDIHYLRQNQANLQKMVTAIRLNQPLAALPSDATPPPGSNFTSVEEMQTRFSDLPEALESTLEIAARCQLELPIDTPRFPEVRLPAGQTSIQVLRYKAENGARKRYDRIDSRIKERLDHELRVIEEKGYAPLFLIMEEIVAHARQSGIPISSRGSAASSLVAYCLEITTPDPLKLNLFFERFLNPARGSPPDIDTDICSRRRDEVIKFVYQRYGGEHVAMVATINRFRRRSAFREVAKAHGLKPAEIKTMADMLPRRWRGPRSRSGESPFEQLIERYPDHRY